MPVNVEQIREYHEYLHKKDLPHDDVAFKEWEDWANWMNEQHARFKAINKVLAAIQEEMAENAYLN